MNVNTYCTRFSYYNTCNLQGGLLGSVKRPITQGLRILRAKF